MKKWMVFLLAFICLGLMVYAGLEALANNQKQMGMFFTFVGGVTTIGLAMDLVNHLKRQRWM